MDILHLIKKLSIRLISWDLTPILTFGKATAMFY